MARLRAPRSRPRVNARAPMTAHGTPGRTARGPPGDPADTDDANTKDADTDDPDPDHEDKYDADPDDADTEWCVIMLMLQTAVGICLAALLAGPSDRGLLERALDEPTHITINDVPLREAFETVTQQTGVIVTMQPAVMALTPWGEDTRVSAEIAGKTLRQGLRDLIGPLGMTFVVVEDHVDVVPTSALARLGRPAGWDDLDTLTSLNALQPGRDPDALRALQGMLQFRVDEPEAWPVLADAVRAVGAGPGGQVLAVACDKLGWAWYLAGPRIVIAPVEETIRRQLQRPISLRTNSRPLIDVLQAIGRESGVRIRLEPGALQSLPLTMQRDFSLNVHLLSGEETLDRIAAYTSLGYFIDPAGVLFYQTGATGAPPAPASPRSRSTGDTGGPGGPGTPPTVAAAGDAYVGKIVAPIDGGVYRVEWIVRASELPPDLAALRRHHLDEAFDALRRTAVAPPGHD